MLPVVNKLIDQLNSKPIAYCHWKSNLALPEALSGQTDIDLLIQREDACAFRVILSGLSFKPVVSQDGESFPSTEHYLALDEETGTLVHVHAYYRVITGESLAKNYHFPIEEMLLQNTYVDNNAVRVPVRYAELVVFTLRMMIKHTSLVELAFLLRDWKGVNQEARWLLEDNPTEQSLRLLQHWLPSVNPDLFVQCVSALELPAPLWKRILLGHRIRSQLHLFTRRSSLAAGLSGIQKFSIMFFRRLSKSTKGMLPQSGGTVIAFVGPEATGKSTLLSEVKGWLGEFFSVTYLHVGKPKATLLSWIPSLLVPALRSLLPKLRSSRVEVDYAAKDLEEQSQTIFPLLFGVRSVMLAYDRRALLAKAYAKAANGNIILCDRYPSASIGAPDSPQLGRFRVPPKQDRLRCRLAYLEQQLYREIPPADVVVSLTVPVEVAVKRNKMRGKTEPEDFVRLRHSQSTNLVFDKTQVHKVNTNRPIEETILEVKKIIWESL